MYACVQTQANGSRRQPKGRTDNFHSVEDNETQDSTGLRRAATNEDAIFMIAQECF